MDTKESVIDVFDKIAGKQSWEKLYTKGIINRLNYNFFSRQRAVEEMLAPYLQKPGLDIGCGSGDLCPFFYSNNVRYTGVDLSQQMIERAKSNYAGYIKQRKVIFGVSDCERLPFDNNSFGTVTAVALIEYLSNPSSALNEIARVTRPSGITLLTVPYRQCINYYIRDLLKPIIKPLFPFYAKLKKQPLAAMKDVKHYRYSENELDSLMRNRGFYKIDSRFTNFHLICHPFDNFIPTAYIKTSEWIDRRRRYRKLKYLGSNYIALYRKRKA